jgi:hypothetical protein
MEIYRSILHNRKRKKETSVVKYTRTAEVENRRQLKRYLLSAAVEMVRRRSATACSLLACSLLASAKALSAFFALPSAAFCDFSAFALAAAATS